MFELNDSNKGNLTIWSNCFRLRTKKNSYLPFMCICMLLGLSVWFLHQKSVEVSNALRNEVDYLKLENAQLQESLQKMRSAVIKKTIKTCQDSLELIAPELEYELTRHKIRRNVNEFWNYLRSRCVKTIQEAKERSDNMTVAVFRQTLRSGRHRYNVIKRDLEVLSETDGYNKWRKNELKDLSNTVQSRLEVLQNPVSCDSAKKLVCNLNIRCGYGCQTHHAVYCLIVAYQSNRTLIFNPDQESTVI